LFYELPVAETREQGNFVPGDDPLLLEIHAMREKFLAAMDDDFNTGSAISVLFDSLRLLNRHIDQHRLAPAADPQSPEVQSLVKKITRTLENERETKWWQKYLDFRTSLIKPAFAVACVLLIAVATIRYLGLKNGNEFQTSSNQQDVQLVVSDKDLEILKNLELLKAMDTIQKLTNVVDPDDDVQSQREFKRNRRGMRRNGHRKVYI